MDVNATRGPRGQSALRSPISRVVAERACIALLSAWVVWLPLPFGSVIERARVPLIVVPIALCAIAAVIRLFATRDRSSTAQPTPAWLIWGGGLILTLIVGLLQLIPLSPSILGVISRESAVIWSSASAIARMAGVPAAAAHPITVDPAATGTELLRIAALFAAFTGSALLIRTHPRRIVLATALCGAGLFEAFYGMREAALQRYEIWGWVNRLIFNRVTGTFVNPNHFAHYLALVLPMAFFIGAVAFHVASSPRSPLGVRLFQMFERRAAAAIFALLASGACVSGMLLSQSRGGLLASLTGIVAVLAMAPGRRVRRVAATSALAVILVGALALLLDPGRTVARFMPDEGQIETLGGRTVGIGAALGVWKRFPILGSGHGTFGRVVAMEQQEMLEGRFHHAHNDYAEIAATAGALGWLVAVAALAGGYVALVRMTFGAQSRELTWRRCAFQAAALASLTAAIVHALLDFNFFIPANPATLSVIVGAAVASVDHDKRTRL